MDGWEWSGDWRADRWYADCDADAWRYASSFPALRDSLLSAEFPIGENGKPVVDMQQASTMARKLPCRWRRWIRPRRRLGGVQSVRVLRGAASPRSELPSDFGGRRGSASRPSEISEIAIWCEGWLARYVGGRWVPHWCVLAVEPPAAALPSTETIPSSVMLFYCNSLETMQV